ncbi:MAG: aldehyde dehydrogenase family protein [Gammaproteobacteria bacterium]|nr:aldehyde dehydrogenase family protein [Gammaproteobacteria bacterium]NNJ77946.1 aldehyde dehydrogenase family protein [Xanthomonadales bacterium]
MYDCTRFYIDGEWMPVKSGPVHEFINPATERPAGRVAYGSGEHVERAVAAARAAFEDYGQWRTAPRIELLESIMAVYKTRWNDIAMAITAEMGAPARMSRKEQTGSGLSQIKAARNALAEISLEEIKDGYTELREPIGVCALITPWNWPINQVLCKVAPALAAGCTMVLKPSEIAPADADILAEILDEAGVPAGVFNLVHGDGAGVGAALCAHPDIDLVSFTGSTRAGVQVAKAAADTVKRVAQELGGKSPNIILDSAPLEEAVADGARLMFHNTGQSCNAPSRMLVPKDCYEEAVAVAATVAEATRPGDPADPDTDIGPVVSERQYRRIQGFIRKGLEEGANVAAGGPGKPPGLETGYFVRPTVFSEVHNDMAVAREEIFGPVLCVIPYREVAEAIAIANDTEYGLSAYVWAGSRDEALVVARQLRAGNVHLNGAPSDAAAPFGGYKQSGNGREWGMHGLEEFMEIKAVMGT